MSPIRLSKFMSLVLRHQPHEFWLSLDAEGFAPLEALVRIVEERPDLKAGRAEVLKVVEEDRPRRFEIQGDRIRARYGHSFKADQPVAYPAVEPPPVLFHGTYPEAVKGIHRDGLRAMKRQYVHLWTTEERAREVARRRTRTPVILRIRAGAAHAAGVVFHSPEPNHYLVRAIPVEFAVARLSFRRLTAQPAQSVRVEEGDGAVGGEGDQPLAAKGVEGFVDALAGGAG